MNNKTNNNKTNINSINNSNIISLKNNNVNSNHSSNNIDENTKNIIRDYIYKPEDYTFKNNYINNNNLKKIFSKPIGLYDPYGDNVNPFTGKPYENLYKKDVIEIKKGPLLGSIIPKTYLGLAYNWSTLEVYKFLNPIINSIRNNQITLIKAGTGVGKTVIVPKIALQAFNFQKKVVCTVPKQKTARTSAVYSAQCLDVHLGNEVGYYYMGDNKTQKNTKLTFTTPGSLKSKITGDDPYLSEYSCVLIDEIHERSVQTDQLLLMMKGILEKRPEFRLILMSATVPMEVFKNYFTKNTNFTYNEISIEGKTFDVEVIYEKKPINDWKIEAVNKIMHILNTTDKGDILVFIRAGGDGNYLCEEIKKKTRNLINKMNPFCITLESKTTPSDTNYAINEFKYLSHPNMDPNHPFTRKIVMATNVAESALTVDGVVYVIDNGYAMEASFYPLENARSLIEERISQAAATQRKGRAGRTTSGYCYRLYTEEEFKKFPEYPTPDIKKTDITPDILDIYKLNYIKNTRDVRNFLKQLISPPSEEFISSSLNKLYALNAINGLTDLGQLTELGKALTEFRAIECNFAKSILASYYYHCSWDVINIILIAMQIDGRIDNLFDQYRPRDKRMNEKEIKRQEELHKKKQKSFYSSYGDYFTLLNVYNELKNYMKNNPEGNPKIWCKENGISSRTFIKKSYPKDKSWDLIGEKARKLNQILFKIVRPAHLRKEYYKEYKNDGAKENISEINKELQNKNKIVDPDADLLSDDIIIKVNNNNLIQNGGYEAKPYEINLFPEANKFDTKEKNILISLAIGNITNLAKIVDEKKNIYKTCFPIKKVFCKFDMNTTLSTKNRTKIVLYNELFTRRKDEKILKLNLVTKLPQEIILKIKKDYNNFIKTCFEKETFQSHNSQKKTKFSHKTKKYSKTKKFKKRK
jgi:HrpA-like RNA helicase